MTECIQESFGFTAHFSRCVESSFSGGQVTSDGGALLLREVDGKINLLRRLTACFTDQLTEASTHGRIIDDICPSCGQTAA